MAHRTTERQFDRKRIHEVLNAAKTAKRPSLRKHYWRHAHFLAGQADWWTAGKNGRGRLCISEITRKMKSGATYGITHYVTRAPGRERQIGLSDNHPWSILCRRREACAAAHHVLRDSTYGGFCDTCKFVRGVLFGNGKDAGFDTGAV